MSFATSLLPRPSLCRAIIHRSCSPTLPTLLHTLAELLSANAGRMIPTTTWRRNAASLTLHWLQAITYNVPASDAIIHGRLGTVSQTRARSVIAITLTRSPPHCSARDEVRSISTAALSPITEPLTVAYTDGTIVLMIRPCQR